LAACQALVGGRIERTDGFPNGDELYANEEGLFLNLEHAFVLAGRTVPVFGNAYIVGPCNRHGHETDVRMTPEFVKERVRFVSAAEAWPMIEAEHDRLMKLTESYNAGGNGIVMIVPPMPEKGGK
jgi:hypothetical protein